MADRGWRRVAVLASVWALLATGWAAWLRWGEQLWVGREEAPRDQVEAPRPDRRVLRQATFEELPGWTEDHASEALDALLRTCARFTFRGPSSAVTPEEVGGRVSDWEPFCRRIAELGERLGGARDGAADAAVRSLLERETVPFQVLNHDDPVGLFTGYYEPLLHGRKRRSPGFEVPLYRRPPELVEVDLGSFREDLSGRRIAGKLDGARLVPYADRGQIDAGALAGRGLELVWVDDPVDAFFLQIQGSGQVEMEDGERIRVGYDGQNGHPYYAIGRELIRRGALAREEVSLQSIAAWLRSHPGEAARVMATNASYVFFRQLRGAGPIGSLGVALVPGRSLAVDRKYLPLGAPVWVDATHPSADGSERLPLRRLMVAQDTGGAITGPVRGDVFWGAGTEAEGIAGRMQDPGRLWVLLPQSLAGRAGVGRAPASASN